MKKLFRDIKAYHTNPLDRSELKMLESGNFYGLLDNEENGFDDFINEINNYLAGIFGAFNAIGAHCTDLCL